MTQKLLTPTLGSLEGYPHWKNRYFFDKSTFVGLNFLYFMGGVCNILKTYIFACGTYFLKYFLSILLLLVVLGIQDDFPTSLYDFFSFLAYKILIFGAYSTEKNLRYARRKCVLLFVVVLKDTHLCVL